MINLLLIVYSLKNNKKNAHMRRFLRLNRHYDIYSYAFFTVIYTSYHD